MKHWKVIAAASAIAFVVNFSFAGAITPGIPKGWSGRGDIATHYESGIDTSQSEDGHPAFFISGTSAGSENFAAVSQVLDASSYRGKTMELTAAALHFGELGGYDFWVRTVDDKGQVGVYSTRARLNPQWEKVRIRVAVAPGTQKLEIGFGVRGKQKLLVKDIHFAEAEAGSPTPDVKPLANRIPLAEMTQNLQNLNFIE